MKDHDRSVPVSSGPSPGSSVRIGIKWYAIISASGKAGPIVLHLEDPDMPEGEHAVFEVVGLCLNDTGNGVGYVVFTKTSNDNASFYSWLVGKVILPWLTATRTIRSEDMKTPSCIVCDGEDIQILEFANKDLADKLKETESVTN